MNLDNIWPVLFY